MTFDTYCEIAFQNCIPSCLKFLQRSINAYFLISSSMFSHFKIFAKTVGKTLAFRCFNLHFFSETRDLFICLLFISSVNCLFILLPIFLLEYFFLCHIHHLVVYNTPYILGGYIGISLGTFAYLKISIFIMCDWQLAWYRILRSHSEAGKVHPDLGFPTC